MSRKIANLLLFWVLLIVMAFGAISACSGDDDDDSGDDDDLVTPPADCPENSCPAGFLSVMLEDKSCLCSLEDETDDFNCDALVPEACALPWPSNHFTKADPDTQTGLRLDYRAESMPANIDGKHVDPASFNRMDGFPSTPQIMFYFPGGVDRALLTPRADLSLSVGPEATTMLINLDDGTLTPHYADTDGRTNDIDDQVTFVRPMIALAPNGHYGVAVRNLKTIDGSVIEPSPTFRALRDEIPTNVESIEARRPDMEKLFSAVESAGWGREELILAWDFTVRSDHSATKDLLHLSDLALAAIDDEGGYQYVIDKIEHPGGDKDTHIEGRVRFPLFLENANPGLAPHDSGATLTRDADGTVIQNGWTEEVPFLVNIPPSVANGEKWAKFLIYGHGLLGGNGEANGGYLNCMANQNGYVVVATDWWGMNAPDRLFVAAEILPDFSNFYRMTERLHQGILNTSLMSDFILKTFAASEDFAGSSGKIDNWEPEVFYYGNSQGGIFGPVAVAIDRNITRAVFGVPGMIYSYLIPHSTDFVELDLVMGVFYPSQIDWEIGMSGSQSLWDFVEPATYIPYVVGQPLAGRPAKQGLWQIGVGDAQVEPMTMDIAGRSWGIPQMGPAVDSIYRVEEASGPVQGSALAYYDPELETRLDRNIFPDDDHGTHEAVRRSIYSQRQLDHFVSEGEIIQTCDGPCDATQFGEQCQ